MNNEVIDTKNAPKALGPYSKAIRSGNLLFISGQVPIDPVTGKFVEECYSLQVKQCMNNLKAILNECGLTLDNLVKITIFTRNMEKYNEINMEYAKHFNRSYPTRTIVESKFNPKEILIVIEAIASFN